MALIFFRIVIRRVVNVDAVVNNSSLEHMWPEGCTFSTRPPGGFTPANHFQLGTPVALGAEDAVRLRNLGLDSGHTHIHRDTHANSSI